MKRIWRSSLPPPSSFLETDDCLPAVVRHDDGLMPKRQGSHLHGSGPTYAMRRLSPPDEFEGRAPVFLGSGDRPAVGLTGDRDQKTPMISGRSGRIRTCGPCA